MFGKFLASPYHTGGKNCKPLFKQLQKFHPDFETDKISYETLYNKLYPGRKFNKQVMWNLVSAMEKFTKEFLVQDALKKHKLVKMNLMLSEFGTRKLSNNYLQTLNEIEKLLEPGGIDYEYFDKKGHLENYKQTYYHSIDRVQSMGDSKLKASEYQIMLFLRMTVGGLNDLKVLSEKHNYKFDVNIPLEFAKNLDLKKIVDYAYKKNFEFAYLIEIYYHSLMMFLEPEQSHHFDRLRELYGMHFDRFTMSEKRNMMHWIVNYCVNNADTDEIKYMRIIFELNEFRLREGLVYYPEGQISKKIYIQILNAALAINETDWAVNFIKNYTINLQPDIRESMRCMANAFLYFHTKDYRKVLANLNKVEFIDVQDRFFARTLTARSYYELNEFESLLLYIDSSLHFLVNNPSVSGIQRKYNHSFFKYLKKIIYIKENVNNEEIHILRNEIEKNEEITNKKWLLEKLNELENAKRKNT